MCKKCGNDIFCYCSQNNESHGVSASGSNELLCDCVGTYEIKTHTGNVYTIKIIKRDGVLGCWLEITKNFIPVSSFIEVDFLKRYSDDEVNRFHC